MSYKTDIAFSASVVSMHMHSPRGKTHGNCAPYSKIFEEKSRGTSSLLKKNGTLRLDAESVGLVMLISILHIYWRQPCDLEEQKQIVVARSSIEAEFRAIAQGVWSYFG